MVQAAQMITSGIEGAMLVAAPYGHAGRFQAAAASLLAGLLRDKTESSRCPLTTRIIPLWVYLAHHLRRLGAPYVQPVPLQPLQKDHLDRLRPPCGAGPRQRSAREPLHLRRKQSGYSPGGGTRDTTETGRSPAWTRPMAALGSRAKAGLHAPAAGDVGPWRWLGRRRSVQAMHTAMGSLR